MGMKGSRVLKDRMEKRYGSKVVSLYRCAEQQNQVIFSHVCALLPLTSRGLQLIPVFFLLSQGQNGAPGFPGDVGDRGYTVRPALQDSLRPD